MDRLFKIGADAIFWFWLSKLGTMLLLFGILFAIVKSFFIHMIGGL